VTLDLIEVLVQEGVLVLVTLRFFDEVVLTGGVWAASQLLLVGSNVRTLSKKFLYRDTGIKRAQRPVRHCKLYRALSVCDHNYSHNGA